MAPPLARFPKAARMLSGALGASLIFLAVLAAPAAASFAGPEDPASPNAGDISAAYWVMLVIAALIALAVNAGIVVAVIRYRVRRGRTPARTRSARGLQRRLVGALAVPVAAIVILGIVFTERARDVAAAGPQGLQAALTRTAQVNPPPPSDSEPLEINAIGQQWLWRFEYPGGTPGARTFSYEELVVPVDTPVILHVTSTDVVHRWWVPSLGGKVDAVPGQIAQTWFRADEVGTYEGHSAQFSGPSYPTMRATVRAVSATEYQDHVDQLKRDLLDAQKAVQTEVEERTAEEAREATLGPGAGASGGGT
jgi:cytochrome c oxidase subunit II